METGNQEDAERYANKCMATYQVIPHRPWFQYCTLDRLPWHRVHVAHDAGGGWLIGWENTDPEPEH